MSSSPAEPTRGRHVQKGVFTAGTSGDKLWAVRRPAGLHRTGLCMTSSVLKLTDRPPKGSEPRCATWYPKQVLRGSGSLRRQVWAVTDFRPILSLPRSGLFPLPSPGWTPLPGVWTNRLPKVTHFGAPRLPPARSSPWKRLGLIHYLSSQNQRENSASVEQTISRGTAVLRHQLGFHRKNKYYFDQCNCEIYTEIAVTVFKASRQLSHNARPSGIPTSWTRKERSRELTQRGPEGAGLWGLWVPPWPLLAPGRAVVRAHGLGAAPDAVPHFRPLPSHQRYFLGGGGGAKKLFRSRNALSSLPEYYIVSYPGRLYSDSFELWSCLHIYLFMDWLLYMLLIYWSLIWILSEYLTNNIYRVIVIYLSLIGFTCLFSKS